MVVGAIVLLHHELHDYHFHEIETSLLNLPLWRIFAAIGLTVFNYLLLTMYDLTAVRTIGRPMAYTRVAMTSFCGFVASYNFGPLLGGASVRYRLYSAWGLSGLEIVQVVFLLSATFWLGLLTLSGVTFISAGDALPLSGVLSLAPRVLGFVLLALVAGYILMTRLHRGRFYWRDEEIQLPSTRLSLLQTALGVFDLCIAAGVLYLLIAPGLRMSYFSFLTAYLCAIFAIVFTQAPGGAGVLELVVLKFAAVSSLQTAVAGLLAYRVIFYLAPLLAAAAMLAWNETRSWKEPLTRVMKTAGRWSGAAAPALLSFSTFVAGVILLFSSTSPAMLDRLRLLRRVVPLPLVEASHFLSSLTGVGLLLLSQGLRRRLDSAYWLTVGLLYAGVIFSLLKGFDYEEAIILSLVLASLIACRGRFYRKGAFIHQRLTPGWIAAVLMAVVSAIGLGLFAYKHVDYSNDLWWRFTLRGDAPRFMRASVGMGVVLLVYAVRRMLEPADPPPGEPTAADLVAVRAIVASSPRTPANLALLGDKRFLFNKKHDAFIMYAVQGRSWVSMGDPVGAPEEFAELVWRFFEQSDRYGGGPVFYEVDHENAPLYVELGLTLLKIGEEARIYLPDFSMEGSARKGLRQTVSRMTRAGVEFEIAAKEDVTRLAPRLRTISDEWLVAKNAHEKGFSLGFFDESYLSQFPCAVLKQDGEVIAFANIWMSADRQEFSIDLMRHANCAPPSAMEYLFIELILRAREEGYQWFNLGMAPLSGIEARPLSPLWNKAMDLIFRHGDAFYGFQGLRAFKNKFAPVWRSKYVAAPGGMALPRVLSELVALIGRRRP